MYQRNRWFALSPVVATMLSLFVLPAASVRAQDAPVPAPSPSPLAIPTPSTTAQDVPIPAGEFDKKPAPKALRNMAPELIIAGQVVMRLRTGAGGMTAQERGYDLSQRIGPILTLPNLAAGDVRVQQLHPGETASIYVRDRLLVTVDRGLAAANNATVDQLAEVWADNLRATLPKINVAVRMTGGMSQTASSSLPAPKSKIAPKYMKLHKRHR